ncbi:helix-turn-helix transcriptional regulator [Edwardsiella hoshinae]|uniref:Arabinose operon regulatory protein n=1 Tax=Edwardsiella hoshinae TaxID=93378 RepID=A0A376D9C4_9GAMM|nr:helix-turn-helix transcriptional regulator [Edwardsiella hoshinae]QPR28008.1 helix-turn-helix transcriptional regulator [Edwardsiella hoshinae]STC85158.1 HTH-type transcriptional repressor of iron proteins A [Edwardsiella hoshinae]
MEHPLLAPHIAASHQGAVIIARVIEPTGRIAQKHSHNRGQVVCAFNGVMVIQLAQGAWLLPPRYLLWLPPHQPHRLQSLTHTVPGIALYIRRHACLRLPQQPCILPLSSLLQAALQRVLTWDEQRLDAQQQRLAAVILDEIVTLPPTRLALAYPSDPRLQRIACALTQTAADPRSAEAWAHVVGLSRRTLSRRFVQETGMHFTAWRQRLRLLQALPLLAHGDAVTAVALQLGYTNISAFITLFRRQFGITPGQYRQQCEGALSPTSSRR